MEKRITFINIWSDDDIYELKIEVCDGNSTFCNNVYIDHSYLRKIISDLSKLSNNKKYQINIGTFNPQHAGGAFQATLNIQSPLTMYIATHQQSDYETLFTKEIASEAKIYLISKPEYIQSFLAELKLTQFNINKRATLQCI